MTPGRWGDRLAGAGQWLAGRLRLLVFRIDEDKVSFEHRGIPVSDDRARERLEGGARHFSRGFKAAMRDTRPHRIAARIEEMDPDFHGFAYEGAGMALSVLDGLLPRRRRLAKLLAGPGERWAALIYIGVGWTLARVNRVPQRPPARLDPILGWAAHDGAGFHQGFLRTTPFVDEQERPPDISGPALRVFDQGIGRSLLFVRGDDLELVRDTVDSFPPERRPDLWSGVGLAATYAGGLGEERLRRLRELAHPHELRLAQGSAFATMSRVRAGNVTSDTELGASVLCGAPASEVAERAERALAEVSPEDESPFEAWQARLRESFAKQPTAL
jgi:hypothetical protein